MNYPYYHYIGKNTFLADRELLKLQWHKMQFRELMKPRIEKAITVVLNGFDKALAVVFLHGHEARAGYN